MQTQFKQWKQLYGVVGGGLWNDYDISQTNGSFQAYERTLWPPCSAEGEKKKRSAKAYRHSLFIVWREIQSDLQQR